MSKYVVDASVVLHLLSAEYIALTQLQADAFVTLDTGLAAEAGDIVPTGKIEELV